MANLIWDDAIANYRYDDRPGEPSYQGVQYDPAIPESAYGLNYQSQHDPAQQYGHTSMSRYTLTPDVQQKLTQTAAQTGQSVINLDGANYVKRQPDGSWAYIDVPATTGGARVDPNTGEVSYYPTEQGGLFGLGPVWGSVVGAGLVLGAGFGIGAGAAALGVAPGAIGVGGMGAGGAAGAAGAAGGAGAVGGGAAGFGGAGGTGFLAGGGGGVASAIGGGAGSAAPAIAGGGAALGGLGAAAPAIAGGAGAAAPVAGGAAAAGGGLMSTLGTYAPLISTGIGAVGSVIGAGIQGNAARDAATTQANAANAANQVQYDMYNQNRADLAPYRMAGYGALAQQAGMMDTPLTYGNYTAPAALDPSGYAFNADPYAFQGTPALDPSGYNFQGIPAMDPSGYAFNGGQYDFNSQGTGFTPPSGQEVLNQDPGYQFRVQQGQQALERSAAGKGQLLSGGQLKGAARFSQDLASQEYGAAYGRSLGENQLRYGRSLGENQMAYGRGLEQNQMTYGRGLTQNQDAYARQLTANQLGYSRAYAQNQDIYNRGLTQNQMGYERALAGNEMTYGRAMTANEQAAQRGLQEYQTNLGTQTGLRNLRYNELAGIAGTGQVATNLGAQLGAQTGTNVGNNLTSAGAAQAAGQVGQANAIAGGFQGVGNAASNYLNYQLLQNYLQQRK